MEVDLEGKEKPGEPATVKVKDALEEACRRNIESRAFLAQGLKALAESGRLRERELARAALQQADACETYAQTALQSCTGATPPPTPGAADANTPATPLPGTSASLPAASSPSDALGRA
jgi:hypothetical protein